MSMTQAVRIRSLMLLLCAGFSVVSLQAQEVPLGTMLTEMRQEVDADLELLRPLFGQEPLATWSGRSGLSPDQVNALMDQVKTRLEALQPKMDAFGAAAATVLAPGVLAPVQDDLGIAARDLGSALVQLPLAAQAHEEQATHALGCQHDNPSMRTAVEMVRDISATLALVDETLHLFGIIDEQ